MKCQTCNFENIPGQKRCLQCGTILEVQHATTNIYPPRMSSWKKPFRDIFRWFRHQKVPDNAPRSKIPRGAGLILSDELIGLLLSTIPGLAHLINGRLKEIRLLLVAWLILLSFGLFFYGSNVGFILLGSAIGVHAWIGLQYGLFKDLTRVIERIVTMLIVIFVLMLIYRVTQSIIFHDFMGSYTSLGIPHYNIESGDYLVARRIVSQENLIPRGSVVLFYPARVNMHYTYSGSRSRNMTVGEIIGLPGELVEIKNNIFIINGQQLDYKKFPVPDWLRNSQVLITVDDNSYFVSSQYSLTIRGRVSVTNQHIRETCIVKATDIEGRAFMRWWPLSRRGLIR